MGPGPVGSAAPLSPSPPSCPTDPTPPAPALASAPPLVSADLRRRNPLLTEAGARLLRALLEHSDAPRWNYRCGDLLTSTDLRAIEGFRTELATLRCARRPGPPDDALLRKVAGLRPRVAWFRRRLPPGADLERDWDALPTTSREDLAATPGDLMPDDSDLERLVVHATSGTTGHPVLVPHHPFACSAYKPLLEVALAAYGIHPRFGPEVVGAFLVCAQAHTVTYATVHAAWRDAGFAKLNLAPADWPTPESAARYFDRFQPLLLTGDPGSFAEMLRLKIAARPLALVSTAVALQSGLQADLAAAYGCPVLDWYSLNEVGPVAYACPRGFLHVLPHDLHVEAVDAGGRAVPPGERGELAATGGRNPFLPLFRYRTGDWGRMVYEPCACGDPMPRILDLEGRAPVLFRTRAGAPVNAVDVSRVLRPFSIVQHAFVQRADLSCELVLRPAPGRPDPDAARLEHALREIFGPGIAISVRLDARLGLDAPAGKVVAYRSEVGTRA
ncbi:MAG: phenylacetate--CoA ligase family protein [Planctomycetes bacterium]|nr:phenylacetate--CoA ligase family protein [Planctomycetota bacterium]